MLDCYRYISPGIHLNISILNRNCNCFYLLFSKVNTDFMKYSRTLDRFRDNTLNKTEIINKMLEKLSFDKYNWNLLDPLIMVKLLFLNFLSKDAMFFLLLIVHSWFSKFREESQKGVTIKNSKGSKRNKTVFSIWVPLPNIVTVLNIYKYILYMSIYIMRL